ncbi:nucleotide excision repair endonuclease [Dyella jejuensis]|uniref:Nucleotide excision repair endonuclease n=1 Tax=Dyella jejuensis TaxID=1432009 RepID=A0ABW8JGH7_9GAMM
MSTPATPQAGEVVVLPDLANTIVERAMSNMRRKLVAGYRNKKNSRPNAKTSDPGAVLSDTLDATSASSVLAVGQRGQAWKEMIQKSLSSGISSLSSMKFDGEFTVTNGQAEGLENVPKQPGVYVVYDKAQKPLYVGDSTKLQTRWVAGHLNAYRQGKKSGESYKLETALDEGCTVKYIVMDSEATAAALEAHLIRTEEPPINTREELKTEQGKRSNIEAKKMKDASGSTASLALGAATEAGIHALAGGLEQMADAVCFALKDELVDIVGGGKTTLRARIERFFKKVFEALKALVSAPLQLLGAAVEFVVNALSKAIGEIYMLARNLFYLARTAWELYRGSQTMSKEELIRKISETILISASLVFWDALDPLLESNLVPLVGPAAPYLAAALSAIGFGVTSYFLRQAVPAIVSYLVNLRTGWHDALDAQRAACDQLLVLVQREIELIGVAYEYFESTKAFIEDTQRHTEALRQHRAIEPLDIQAMLRALPGKKDSLA